MKIRVSQLLECALAYLAFGSSVAMAQFVPGQILSAQQLNNAFSSVLPISGGTLAGPLTVPSLIAGSANISGGTISGLSSPLPVASGGTGTATATGTGSVVLSNSPAIANGLSISNGIDVITVNNNSNNVLVLGGAGTSTAKSIAVTSLGGLIASSTTNVGDGVALKSDYYNTAVFQGLNSSGTAGYDTNLTLYRPASTNNAFLGVTMSANPAAEQHLWMGTDYTNNRYVFAQTVTGTGQYLPVQFRGGTTDAFTLTISGNVQFDNQISAASPELVNGTLSNCGTGPSVSSANDVRGTLTMGTGGVMACTYTFHKAYASTPSCVITGLSTGSAVLSLSALSTTGFTIASSSDISGKYITYVCMQ